MNIDNLEDVKEFLESNENDIEKKKSLYMKILANITLKKKYPDTNNDYDLVKLNQNKEYMKHRTIFSPGWKTTNELNNPLKRREENWKADNLERMVSSLPLTILEHFANISKFNEDFLTNLVMAKHVDELNNDAQYGPEHFLSDVSFFDPNYGGIKSIKKKKRKTRNTRKTRKSRKTKKSKKSKRSYKKY